MLGYIKCHIYFLHFTEVMKLCHPYENELTNKHKCENERQWKKKKASRNTYDFASIKRVTRKFHVAVVQNYSKEMCKKVCCTGNFFFFAN